MERLNLLQVITACCQRALLSCSSSSSLFPSLLLAVSRDRPRRAVFKWGLWAICLRLIVLVQGCSVATSHKPHHCIGAWALQSGMTAGGHSERAALSAQCARQPSSPHICCHCTAASGAQQLACKRGCGRRLILQEELEGSIPTPGDARRPLDSEIVRGPMTHRAWADHPFLASPIALPRCSSSSSPFPSLPLAVTLGASGEAPSFGTFLGSADSRQHGQSPPRSYCFEPAGHKTSSAF